MRYLLGILLLASAAMAQDSLNVTRVGQLSYLNAFNVLAAEPYVYVLGSGDSHYDGNCYLHIFDVTNPAAPAQVGVVEFTGQLWVAAVEGHYAYVVAVVDSAWWPVLQMQVINLQTPSEPEVVGTCSLPPVEYVYGIAAKDSHAYVALGDSGLRIIDVSDPIAPHEVATWIPQADVTDVVVKGDRLYLPLMTEHSGSLRVLDVSNPALPQEIGLYDGYQLRWLSIAGDHAYAVDWNDIAIFGIALPVPVLEGWYYGPMFYATDMTVNGPYAYVVSWEWYEGMQVINMSDPLDPVVVGTCYLPVQDGWYPAVATGNSYVYVADAVAGLRIFDVSTASNPHEIGAWQTPTAGRNIAVRSGTVFVADDESGIICIDVQDPARIKPVGIVDSLCNRIDHGTVYDDIAIRGDYAYVTNSYCYLQAIDIRNPSSTVSVGFADTTALSKELVIAGNYAYVTDTQGLAVLDLSDSTLPTFMGHCNLPIVGGGFAANGLFAIVSTTDSGLTVVDISQPALPTAIGYCPVFGVRKIALHGTFAYASDWISRIKILDLNYPSTPVQIATYDSLTSINDIAAAGDFLYVANGANGLIIFDISSPAQLLEVGHYRTASTANALAVEGSRVYVTCDNSLEVFDISAIVGEVDEPVIPQPRTFALGEAYPNPFNATTVIPFALPQTTHISLKVYDVLGREAAVLVDGVREAGEHRASWTAAGIAAGVYFVRLEAGRMNLTRKIVLMR